MINNNQETRLINVPSFLKYRRKGKVAPVHAMKVYGSGVTGPHILNLGTRWRRVIDVIPWERTPALTE
jgi:hypothetical protein